MYSKYVAYTTATILHINCSNSQDMWLIAVGYMPNLVIWIHVLKTFCLIRWCCDPDKRLGNIDEIKAHPFFNGVDWQNIRYHLNCCSNLAHILHLITKIRHQNCYCSETFEVHVRLPWHRTMSDVKNMLSAWFKAKHKNEPNDSECVVWSCLFS